MQLELNTLGTSSQVDLSQLSSREEEILYLAVEGLTDQQIAQRIGISPSTVNSYWTRIRTKLGRLSRVEMVSIVLKQKIERLERAGNKNQETRNPAPPASQSFPAELYRAAFDACPEALLILDSDGLILSYNLSVGRMFGCEESELVQKSVLTLFSPTCQLQEKNFLQHYLESDVPCQLGLDRVIFGQRKDGAQFRIMVALNTVSTSLGRVTSAVVRNFIEEIDLKRRFINSLSREAEFSRLSSSLR